MPTRSSTTPPPAQVECIKYIRQAGICVYGSFIYGLDEDTLELPAKLEAKIVTGTVNKPLFRCRWLCNAKPDIMIHSGEHILFIEVKVESGMGSSEQGYSQEQTQNDIIDVGIKVIDWMRQGHVKRINLTHLAEEKDIAWKEITDIHSRTKIQSDIGADMLHRHFQNMPKPKINKECHFSARIKDAE